MIVLAVFIDFKQALSEDLKSLRRELALISRDYREILVSFYIDDKKVSQIAREFNLPEGTVKTKLFKSRKIITEGMKMAREFGVKSYRPENVNFIGTGNYIDGSPWQHLQKKIAKNILLEAYYNPSSIEELSLELGVAAPYLEEEVDILVNAELLKKLNGGKYETDFMILSAEAQREMENANLKIKDEYFSLIKELWEKSLPMFEMFNSLDKVRDKGAGEHLIRENDKILFGGYQTLEELKWLYILSAVDNTAGAVIKEKYPDKKARTKRADGGEWDFMGKEEFTPCPENFFIGHNCGVSEDAQFWIYVIFTDWGKRHDIYNQAELRVILDMFNGKADENKDKNMIKFLLDNGVFEIKDNKYVPKFAVFSKGEKFHCDQKVKSRIKDLHMKLFNELEAVIKKNIPERLQDKLSFYTDAYALRSYIIDAAIKDGFLKIPENFNKSMVGVSLVFTK